MKKDAPRLNAAGARRVTFFRSRRRGNILPKIQAALDRACRLNEELAVA